MQPTSNYESYLEQLYNKLSPASIRSTLMFAALFQMTHESIKALVLDRVKGFYGFDKSHEAGSWCGGDISRKLYEQSVLSLNPKSAFGASLIWLKTGGAISQSQLELLGSVYDHRHELTHELPKFLVDVDVEIKYELLSEALVILRRIETFWIQQEIDIGAFEGTKDVSIGDITSSECTLLELCIEAVGEDLPPDTGGRTSPT